MRSFRSLLGVFACSACAPQIITAIDSADAGGTVVNVQPDAGIGGAAADAGAGAGTEAGAPPDPPSPEPTLRGDALLHRYGFEGSGATAIDSKGAAHGVLNATRLSGRGFAQLQGGALNQYIDLPNGLISGLTDATFEVWITWDGGPAWQRVFDFGDSTSMIEDERNGGRSYLFLSPHGSGDFVRAVYRSPMAREVIIDATPALQVGVQSYTAVVFDDSHDRMRLYIDGGLVGEVALDGKLSRIHDVNDWLGQSQFAVDPAFAGEIDEFRVYDAALSAGEIAKSFEEGPDAHFVEP